jgi:hypothetical protein
MGRFTGRETKAAEDGEDAGEFECLAEAIPAAGVDSEAASFVRLAFLFSSASSAVFF